MEEWCNHVVGKMTTGCELSLGRTNIQKSKVKDSIDPFTFLNSLNLLYFPRRLDF